MDNEMVFSISKWLQVSKVSDYYLSRSVDNLKNSWVFEVQGKTMAQIRGSGYGCSYEWLVPRKKYIEISAQRFYDILHNNLFGGFDFEIDL